MLLYEGNAPIEYIHFLESGVASLVNTMRNGDAAEVGFVALGGEGSEGLRLSSPGSQNFTRGYNSVALRARNANSTRSERPVLEPLRRR